jgi:hypothetical protein
MSRADKWRCAVWKQHKKCSGIIPNMPRSATYASVYSGTRLIGKIYTSYVPGINGFNIPSYHAEVKALLMASLIIPRNSKKLYQLMITRVSHVGTHLISESCKHCVEFIRKFKRVRINYICHTDHTGNMRKVHVNDIGSDYVSYGWRKRM